MTLRTVGVRLAAEVSGYVNNLRTAKAATADFTSDLDKAARAGHLDAVADQAGRMGLALGGAFAVAVSAAAKFDKQMSEVGAVSDATAADMEKLRQAALKAGADTAFSATEAANAEAELAKAGLNTSQILGGALSGSLSLAAAGSLDLAESADIAAKTMNVFHLKGSDVGHIADVLAAAANKSATDVHEMGEALRMGGLAANAAGMSLEETVGTLAAFADRALVGSDAGTSLKTALMMIQAPTEKSAALMEQLGIRAYDAQGKFIGTARLAGVLQKALGNMTQEQRNAALAQIFGADAMRAANVLYEIGEQGVTDYTRAVNDQGAASDVAAKKMDNLAGDVEKLKGSLETLAIESGSGANGGLRTLVQGANALVDQFAALPPVLGSSITVIAGVAGAALLAGAGWVKMRRATADALEELRSTGPAGQRAATGLQATTKWAGRATVAFVALEVAGAAAGAAFGKDINPQVDALAQSLAKFGATGEKSGEAARLLGADFKHLSYDLGTLDSGFWADFGNGFAGAIESMTGLGDAADESLKHAKERLSAIDSALQQMVTSGHASDAAAAFSRLAEEARKQGVSVDELKAGLPQYTGALQTAGTASGKAANDIAAVGQSAEDAAKAAEDLKKAFDDLFNIEMSLDEATIRYEKGIDDLAESLREGKHTLDETTEAGRDHRSAVLDQIQAIKDLRDARIEHGMVIDEANGKYDAELASLRATLLQLGYNETAVDELIGKYREIPPAVNTVVTANTAPAIATANALIARINEMHARISIKAVGTISYGGGAHTGEGYSTGNRWGGVYQHAAVGALRDAHIASPMGPARYAYAEPQTGGEAFVPKYGDYQRSMGILQTAAGWYGAQVTPRGAGGGGVQEVRIVVEGTGVLRGLRKEIRVEGGNVQKVLGS